MSEMNDVWLRWVVPAIRRGLLLARRQLSSPRSGPRACRQPLEAVASYEGMRTRANGLRKGIIISALEEDLDCGGILCLNDSLRGDATPPRTSRSVILRARPKVIQSASVSQTKTDEKGPRLGPLRFRLGVESLWFAAVLDKPREKPQSPRFTAGR